MPLPAGDKVGPYKIIEKLGLGGMATVYKAYHAGLERYVALKVLHPDLTEDPAFAAVIGPLIEVPVMIGLVNVAFYFQKRMFDGEVSSAPELVTAAAEACPPDERLVK